MSAPFRDIADSLAELARERPSQAALVASDGKRLSALELSQLTDRCAMGLKRNGIMKGTRTVLMVAPGPELMILAFALVKVGAVIVMVDPGMGWKNLKHCLDEARPEAFVGVTRAQLGRVLFRWGVSTVRTVISVGHLRFPGWIPYSRLLNSADAEGENRQLDPTPEQHAAIVFTSGSTGIPKGVVYTRGMFAEQARMLQESFGIAPGEVDLATFPLFALFDPLMKVTTVFPRMNFSRPAQADPGTIADTIEREGVTHMFGSPALLDRLGRFGEESGRQLPTLRRVLSAGAPVQRNVLRRMRKMLVPGATIHTPYGATEALPLCSIPAEEILAESAVGRGVCVGKPLAGVNLEIIEITDESITEWSGELRVERGQIGELVVWGPNVSHSYFERPEANRLAKISVGVDRQPRHRTGDVGFLDEHGRVWFCGRKSHRVIAPGGTLFTIPCESVFNEHPDVFRTALVGIGSPPNQRPVVCVELEEGGGRADRERIRTELLELGAACPQTASIRDFLFHPAFPVDIRHNAKIFREKLAVWAEERLG